MGGRLIGLVAETAAWKRWAVIGRSSYFMYVKSSSLSILHKHNVSLGEIPMRVTLVTVTRHNGITSLHYPQERSARLLQVSEPNWSPLCQCKLLRYWRVVFRQAHDESTKTLTSLQGQLYLEALNLLPSLSLSRWGQLNSEEKGTSVSVKEAFLFVFSSCLYSIQVSVT